MAVSGNARTVFQNAVGVGNVGAQKEILDALDLVSGASAAAPATFNRSQYTQGTKYGAADAAVVLGAGMGTTASFAVDTNSTDSRGAVTVTFGGTGQAQATATITITFKDGTWPIAPYVAAAVAAVTGAAVATVTCLATATATVLTITLSAAPATSGTMKITWFAEG